MCNIYDSFPVSMKLKLWVHDLALATIQTQTYDLWKQKIMKKGSSSFQLSQMRLNEIPLLEELDDQAASIISGGDCRWQWEASWYQEYETGERVSYDGKIFYECQQDGSWKQVTNRVVLGKTPKLGV